MTAFASRSAGRVTPLRASARTEHGWRNAVVGVFRAYRVNSVRRLVANDPLIAMFGRD